MLFEWNNPIGYTMAVSLEYIFVAYVFVIMMITASIGVAFHSYEISLHSIDENSKLRKTLQIFYVRLKTSFVFHLQPF